MTEPLGPGPRARLTGAVYLLYFLLAVPAGYLLKDFATPDDAAGTAARVLAQEDLYRAALAIGIAANVAYIALTALLRALLAPVDRGLSMLAALVSVAGCTLQLASCLLQLAALAMIKDKALAAAFTANQLQTTALFALKMYAQTYTISLVLFGCFNLSVGWLIARSGFLPAILGLAMMAAGAGWLTFLWPPLAAQISNYVLPLGIVAELLLALWLFTVGVNAKTWREKADSWTSTSETKS